MDMNNTMNFLTMRLLTDIRDNLGQETGELTKKWLKMTTKKANLTNRRNFLLTCRNMGNFPNHIINNIKSIYSLQVDEHPFRSSVDNILFNFRRKTLSLEIKVTAWMLMKTEKTLGKLEAEV